jgi:hypothetical protein
MSNPTAKEAKMNTVTYIDADGDKVTAEFATSSEAWAFMRLCDSHGVKAGYPA